MSREAAVLMEFKRRLRGARDNMESLRDNEECVRNRFSHLFAPEGLRRLKAADVREFLTFKGNKHWKGINRYSTAVTTDMPALRRTIAYVVNESVPLAERVNDILRGGEHSVYGLGVASLTPMMWAARPDTYAIYNRRSEATLKNLGVLPRATIGDRYTVLNETVAMLAREYELTPYVIDYILPDF